jgi:hypothetical protein
MRASAGTLGLLLAVTASAAAQDRGRAASRAAAVDTVIGVQDVFGDASTMGVIVDTYTAVALRPNLLVSFRPKAWRKRNGWFMLVDQLSLSYDFEKGSNWRIEAGRFPSPIGLGMTENRASTNPGFYWWHRPLYLPLPSQGPDVPVLSLVSAIYPTGAQVSTAGARWDARAALVDSAPVQFWHQEPAMTSRTPNAIVGGGLKPWPRFRLGASTAWGSVGHSRSGQSRQPYTMLNVEGEYAFGYTKMSGEWTRDRFDAAAGDRIAEGWTVQVRQTVTPRVFAHSRVTTIHAPATPSASKEVTRSRFQAVDSTVGYLLNPELTLRVGHSMTKTWTRDTFEQRLGVSLIWAKRWW